MKVNKLDEHGHLNNVLGKKDGDVEGNYGNYICYRDVAFQMITTVEDFGAHV